MLSVPVRRLTRLPQSLTYTRPAFIRTKRNVARDEDVIEETVQKPRFRKLNEEPDPAVFEDFRKPWFYTVRGIGNFLILPTAFLYAVFFYDWGDHEHVFSPARRWLDNQKAAFFSLSPEERALANTDDAKPVTANDSQQKATKTTE